MLHIIYPSYNYQNQELPFTLECIAIMMSETILLAIPSIQLLFNIFSAKILAQGTMNVRLSGLFPSVLYL